MTVNIFYNAQKGEGLTICYMRYIRGGGLSLLMLKLSKMAIFLHYIICGRPLSRARYNNNCRLVSFHCFIEYEVYYSLESARLSHRLVFIIYAIHVCLCVRPINTFSS